MVSGQFEQQLTVPPVGARVFGAVLNPRPYSAMNIQHFAGIWAYSLTAGELTLCGHIARLRGPGNDLHVMWTYSPKTMMRIGSNAALPIRWPKWEHNGQTIATSPSPEPRAPANPSVQTRSPISTSLHFNMTGEMHYHWCIYFTGSICDSAFYYRFGQR